MAKKNTPQIDAEDAVVVEGELDPQADPDFVVEAAGDPSSKGEELREVFVEKTPEVVGTSIGRTLLNALAIFAIGAVVALWAGPKIAPNLPAGLAPVTRWLTPGQDAALAAVDAAKLELTAKVDALPKGFDEADVGALVDARIAEFDAKLEARIGDLSGASAIGDLAARLAALEDQTSGLVAELAALQSQPVTGSGVAPAQADIVRMSARIDGLQARVSDVAAKYAALVRDVEGVSALASAKIESSAEQVAAAQTETAVVLQSSEKVAALGALKEAAISGAPYDSFLAEFVAKSGMESPPTLAATAASGVTTILALRETFPQLAHEAIRAAIVADSGSGITAGIGGFLKAQVATRSLTPQTGDSADAVLSRMEEALRDEDLAGVLRETKALPDAAKNIMADWIGRVEARMGVEAELAALEVKP